MNVGPLLPVFPLHLLSAPHHTSLPASTSLPLLPMWMNVASLNPCLSDFHMVQYSDRSGCFLFLNLLLSFFFVLWGGTVCLPTSPSWESLLVCWCVVVDNIFVKILCIYLASNVISALSFMILFIWAFSLLFLMSLIKGLSILFIFSRNQLLDSLIVCIISLDSILFICALGFVYCSFTCSFKCKFTFTRLFFLLFFLRGL